MSKGGQLSHALRITNVNDFLAPTNACVLPLEGAAVPAGSVLAPILPSKAPSPVASVTVSDCLSCSGCVTSAETVLLSTESLDTLRSFIKMPQERKHAFFAVATLSQQSVASIAVHLDMDMTPTARKIATFLRQSGFQVVLDNSFARHFSLLEARKEFLQRYRSGKKLTITSACPGWVAYAEKTQDKPILDCISTVRSPQAMAGALARKIRPSDDTRAVWTLSVAQCHDKKLEAVRPEFRCDDAATGKQIDCVITTGELMDLMRERQFNLADAVESDLDNGSSCDAEFGTRVGSGSDGFADFILKGAAKEILGVPLQNRESLFKKVSRSGDLKSATVSNDNETESLCFATAYGFRSLQSILRKIRNGQCAYNYIELMACPGGCNNGGGQLQLSVADTQDARTAKRQQEELLRKVDAKFANAPIVEDPSSLDAVREVYISKLGCSPVDSIAKPELGIVIESRKYISGGSLDW